MTAKSRVSVSVNLAAMTVPPRAHYLWAAVPLHRGKHGTRLRSASHDMAGPSAVSRSAASGEGFELVHCTECRQETDARFTLVER